MKHKKPLDLTPSKLLTQLGREIAHKANGPILDVACGYGRNAAYLASLGASVVCIDNDNDALDSIRSLALADRLATLNLDLLGHDWPFEDESIGAIVNVHFFHLPLLDRFARSLRHGGYLYLETIDGQGRNYLALPPQGLVKSQLARYYDIRYYKEHKVGPEHSDAVTVKVLAVRRRP